MDTQNTDDGKQSEDNERKGPKPLYRNLITLSGTLLAVIAGLFWLSFFLIELIAPSGNPYMGIFVIMVFPGLFAGGLIMIPTGMILARWYRLWRGIEVSKQLQYPRIDWRLKSHRRMVWFIFASTLVGLPVVIGISMSSLHYSSSSEFCSSACHTVMGPQAALFEHSPHARIECTACHIGPGTEHMLKAKINGLNQVLSIVMDSYPRPIPPAAQHLRPAREVCEECHWPSKFFGERFQSKYNYMPDEENTRQEVDLLVNIGGGDALTGPAGGIHWHMALGFKVEYVAVDKHLEDIPWIKHSNLVTGETTVYRSDGKPGSAPPPEGYMRQLDCIDCHNRAAHRVPFPPDQVDLALETGSISRDLPYVKREAVKLLSAEYPDANTAELKIRAGLKGFYEKRYADLAKEKPALISGAAEHLVKLYRSSVFPEMKVAWDTYPDNIGHKVFLGCFRCHDDRHVADNGRKLETKCDTCHATISPGETSEEAFIRGFRHKIDLKGTHSGITCTKCHAVPTQYLPSCTGTCHTQQERFMAGTSKALKRFDIEAGPMFEEIECDDCHVEGSRLSVEAVNDECWGCHEEDGDEFEDMLLDWRKDVEDARGRTMAAITELEQAAAGKNQPEIEKWLADNRPLLNELDSLGWAHNFDAAMAVYQTLAKEARLAKKKLK